MSSSWSRKALRALRGIAGGLESASREERPLDDPDEVVDRALSRVTASANVPALSVEEARAALLRALIEEGRVALRDVSERGEAATINRTQAAGLEAIVRLTDRPSILVQGGTFTDGAADWQEALKIARKMINQSIASVGRLNVRGAALGYLGTAFMVAEDIAVTNQHVAIEIADRTANGWQLIPGTDPTVDFFVEHDRPEKQVHQVLEVIGIHFDPVVDLALIRLAKTSEDGVPLPRPLALSKDADLVASGRRVYVIGYPAVGDDNDASAVDQIFHTVLKVKRLAPGEIMEVRRSGLQLTHDCSTLKGNSGSCVIDMTTHRVLGLHYGGDFTKENRALSVAQVRNDPLVAGRGFNYQ